MQIMLVDDDPLVRQTLLALVPWAQYGWTVGAQCTNGQSALEELSSHAYDVVIADVRMPVMDGLELLRRAMELPAPPRFIMLTSYDDFHLVRAAYRLGAMHYLLKAELQPQSVVQLLKDTQAAIDDAAAQRAEQQAMDAFIDERRAKEVLRALSASLLPHAGYVRLDTAALSLKTPLQRPIVLCAAFDLSGPDVSAAPLQRMREEVLQGLRAWGSWGVLYALPLDEQVLFLWHHECSSASEATGKLWPLLRHMQALAGQCPGWTVTLGASNIGLTDADLPALAAQAQTACAYRYIGGQGRLHMHVQLQRAAGRSFDQAAADRHVAALQRLFAAGPQIESVDAFYRNLVEDQGCLDAASLPSLQALYERLYYAMDTYVASLHFTPRMRRQLQLYPGYLRRHGDLPRINHWLLSLLQEIAQTIQHYSHVTSRAIALIQERYAQPFTLSAAAAALGITREHLSRVFTREVGCGFTEYVNQYRILQAIELFRAGRHYIYDVAAQVGLPNPAYFARLFRRYTGKMPKDYL